MTRTTHLLQRWAAARFTAYRAHTVTTGSEHTNIDTDPLSRPDVAHCHRTNGYRLQKVPDSTLSARSHARRAACRSLRSSVLTCRMAPQTPRPHKRRQRPVAGSAEDPDILSGPAARRTREMRTVSFDQLAESHARTQEVSSCAGRQGGRSIRQGARAHGWRHCQSVLQHECNSPVQPRARAPPIWSS